LGFTNHLIKCDTATTLPSQIVMNGFRFKLQNVADAMNCIIWVISILRADIVSHVDLEMVVS